MSVPLRGDKLLLFCVASCFHLFLLEYRVILEKERGKSRKGKKHQIRKRKKTHQIIDIRQSSRLRAVSPFRFSLSRESKKIKKIPPIKLTVALKHRVTSPSLRRRNFTRESQLIKK